MSAAQWFTVYETATGIAVSHGTIVADPLPAGLSVIASAPPLEGTMWDPATLSFVPVPPEEE